MKLPAAKKSHSYSGRLTAEGGLILPDTWQLVSGKLPTGLVLSAAGKISGKPTLTGAFTFTVRVRDALGQHSQGRFEIKVTK